MASYVEVTGSGVREKKLVAGRFRPADDGDGWVLNLQFSGGHPAETERFKENQSVDFIMAIVNACKIDADVEEDGADDETDGAEHGPAENNPETLGGGY
jgi:hypothetical protein